MGKPRPRTEVFLNLPHDSNFESQFLSYISAIHSFGMAPRVTLEIPGGAMRLDRIFALIQSCEFSVHDLSGVQLDRTKPRTPRFNMPFELGLAVAGEKLKGGRLMWFVMEAMNYRLAKSLSDLNGTDPYVHGGRSEGVFREMGNAFVRRKKSSVPQMWEIYREVRKQIPTIVARCGAGSLFEASAFQQISLAANGAAEKIIG